MTTVLLIGVVIAGAVALILVKMRTEIPKKAGKWEKADIMKQILALSENENGVMPSASSPRLKSIPPRTMHPGQFPKKAKRASQPLRSSK